MFNLNKTVVAVLALSSGVVFAGTMSPVCSAVNATVPYASTTAWDFGARALYLQPAYSGGDYSYSAVNNTTGLYTDYKQNWAWGFLLEGSYHYNTGNDSNLNWYHINQSASRNYSDNFSLLDTSAVAIGTSYIDPKWDAVNLEFGQHADFGSYTHVRFHGGIEYARIANKVIFTGSDPATPLTTTVQSKQSYNGFGARTGVNLDYAWRDGLGFYANGAAALLVGSNKLSNENTVNGGLVITPNASKSTIVPEIEAKLGVKYAHVVDEGKFTLDAGWMWINYFNVTQTIQSSIITGLTPQVVVGDFGLQGLYFGLNWLGNVV